MSELKKKKRKRGRRGRDKGEEIVFENTVKINRKVKLETKRKGEVNGKMEEIKIHGK